MARPKDTPPLTSLAGTTRTSIEFSFDSLTLKMMINDLDTSGTEEEEMVDDPSTGETWEEMFASSSSTTSASPWLAC
jgi:hypothetical protein